LFSLQADPLSGKITLNNLQSLKSKSFGRRMPTKRHLSQATSSQSKGKPGPKKAGSPKKFKKKPMKNAEDQPRKGSSKDISAVQPSSVLKLIHRRMKTHSLHQESNTQKSTEEEIISQKTLKKNVLKNFFKGTNRVYPDKAIQKGAGSRTTGKAEDEATHRASTSRDDSKSRVPKINCDPNSIKLNAEAVRTFEEKKTFIEVQDLSNQLLLEESNPKDKEHSVFRACDLFSRLYDEVASAEVKHVISEIQKFYKTGPLHKIPPTDLQFYKLVKVIGKGSFGKVYLGVQLLTNRLVAIKCLEKNSIKDRGIRSKILQEIEILKTASAVPQVTRLLEVFENKTYVFLVMVYAKGGDLLRYIKNKTRLAEEEAKVLFLKILTGVCGLHSRKILHRDIKLDNILLDEHNEPTICDFGVSRRMADGEVIHEQCGTPAYIAPEVITDEGYSGLKADVWSLGIMLFAMLIGKMPFKGSTISDLHFSITTANFKIPSEPKLSLEAKDLIQKMLVVNPEQRLSSFEVLRHGWLGLDADKAEEILQKTADNRVYIDDDLVIQLTKYGFSDRAAREALSSRKLNHATACYYNLELSLRYSYLVLSSFSRLSVLIQCPRALQLILDSKSRSTLSRF
jgi:5'-AMP-activated protein kinase catalytic alpha subunit